MKTKNPKFDPETVWIVADINNSGILYTNYQHKPLSVFHTKTQAMTYKRIRKTVCEVMKATITLDGEGAEDAAEISRLRDELETSYDGAEFLRNELNARDIENNLLTKKLVESEEKLASLEAQIHEGKIWKHLQ